MRVHITAKYQHTEDISNCLETVSKAVDERLERFPYLFSLDEIELHIEPMDKSDILSSEYDMENFINAISERLKSCPALHPHSQQ